MVQERQRTVTRLIGRVRAGEAAAADSLLSFVYAELRDLAGAVFSGQRSGHTLQPTALVSEAWMKIAGHLDAVEDRVHFYAIAGRAMRQVLIDHARTAGRQKRGGEHRGIRLHEGLGTDDAEGPDLVDFTDSLERLAALNERHARVVELRFLGGLTIAEAARILEISPTTVEEDWFTARAWLRAELGRAQ